MKAFHTEGDLSRLYFTYYERRSDDEEFEEIISVLKRNRCRFEEPMMGPDCDLIPCFIGEIGFNIIRTVDGNGSFLYCDNSDGMLYIESLFEMKE